TSIRPPKSSEESQTDAEQLSRLSPLLDQNGEKWPGLLPQRPRRAPGLSFSAWTSIHTAPEKWNQRGAARVVKLSANRLASHEGVSGVQSSLVGRIPHRSRSGSQPSGGKWG